jgi:hypothetical protein
VNDGAALASLALTAGVAWTAIRCAGHVRVVVSGTRRKWVRPSIKGA